MFKDLLILLIFFLPPASYGQEVLVIKNVNIIDVRNGKVMKNKSVMISGNKIIAVADKVRIGNNAKVVDGRDKYLIPGLWDMHVHALTGDRYVYTFPLLIANGVTGVREMGSDLPYEKIKQLRDEVDMGTITGPRFGSATYRLLDGKGTMFSNVAIEVTSAQQVQGLVADYKNAGADFLKPYNLLSRETYLALVDESKKQNIPVEGHVPFSMTPEEVSNLGQRSIEHNFGVLLFCSRNAAALQQKTMDLPNLWGRLEAEAAASYDTLKANQLYRLFVQNKTWSCPTIIVYKPARLSSDSSLMQDPLLQYIPKSVVSGWHETFMQRMTKAVPDEAARQIRDRMRMFIVGEMYRAGVQLLAGTDMPNPYTLPGFSLHDELALLVESGLSPLAALQTATLNPAIFLDREKELGAIENDKLADLVLLNGNPLENIGNTKKIEAVIANGRLYERRELDALLQQTKQSAMK